MTTKNQEIIDAFNFRHATKRFNVERKINESDFKTIMAIIVLKSDSLIFLSTLNLLVACRKLKASIIS